MEFYDVINRRRTIRDFEERQVPPQVLERVLEAGLKAPSNDHLRNWKFVVIEGRENIAPVLEQVSTGAGKQQEALKARQMEALQQKMYEEAVPKQRRMLIESGCLVLPFYKQKGDLMAPQGLSSLNDFASIWCVIENILLAATAEGLGCSMRIPSLAGEMEHVCAAVGAPEGYVMPCYIGIGYPAKDAVVVEQPAIALEKKICWGKWE